MRPSENSKRRPRSYGSPLLHFSSQLPAPSSKPKGGFTLIEIMIVLLIIGLLLAMALPNFLRSRESTQTNICINNLRQISAAKNQWAIENNQKDGDVPSLTDLEPYFKGGTGKAYCSQDSTKSFSASYDVQAIGLEPTCKINPSKHKL